MKLSLIGCILFLLACNNSDQSKTVTADQQIVANTVVNVTPVSACKKLTLEKVALVYPDKKFSVETDRNDPPNIYEALSACRYQEDGVEVFDKYYLDLEIRAKASSADASKMISDSKLMDYDKKGRDLTGIGDLAFYSNLSMASGGPRIEFTKDNVYYKLTIQTIKKGSFASLEKDIIELAKKILE